MTEPHTTSWMWPSAHGGVNGAIIDTNTHTIQWFDEVGCACGDSVAVQSFEQFRQAGTPISSPPEATLGEIRTVMAALEAAR